MTISPKIDYKSKKIDYKSKIRPTHMLYYHDYIYRDPNFCTKFNPMICSNDELHIILKCRILEICKHSSCLK